MYFYIILALRNEKNFVGADGSYRRWTDVHRQGGRSLTVKSVLWTVIETETPTQGQKHDGEAGWAGSVVFQSSAFYFSEELAFLYLKYRMGENAM